MKIIFNLDNVIIIQTLLIVTLIALRQQVQRSRHRATRSSNDPLRIIAKSAEGEGEGDRGGEE